MHKFLTGSTNVADLFFQSEQSGRRSTSRGLFRQQKGDKQHLDEVKYISKSLDESHAWYECMVKKQLETGQLFKDSHMPPVDSTVDPKFPSVERQYRWLRPTKIRSKPQFISDGVSRFDVVQGGLGDCWLLAAVANLSLEQNLLEKVLPIGQSFSCQTPLKAGKSYPYCGMFWFRFWQFGYWYDVVVDDRLPTTEAGELVFMHSTDPNEFWSALLEKAYAKLAGSYAALRGGSTAEAMEDFTGGLTEIITMSDDRSGDTSKLFDHLLLARSRSSLLGCSIDADEGEYETSMPNGLVKGHAYSITDVRKVQRVRGARDYVKLLRLRNPWGGSSEWNGAWSDSSREWKAISESDRIAIGLTFEDDGEFWISFDDFVENFDRLELCHLGPDTVGEAGTTTINKVVSSSSNRPKRYWESTVREGEWVCHATAGGCRNFKDTFHKNPQYHVEVVDPDLTDDDDYGTLIVGLMQKSMRRNKQQCHIIGYSIYRLSSKHRPERMLTKEFFANTSSTCKSTHYINTREVCGRHKLRPGHYVIIPTTYEPQKEAEFLLRLFSEKACQSNEMDDVTQIVTCPQMMPKIVQDNAGLRQAFKSIAGDEQEIDAFELQTILNQTFIREFSSVSFSIDCTRSMITLMDVNLSGRLDFDEFQELWEGLRLWKHIFKKFDADGNGKMNIAELRQALGYMGVHVNNHIYCTMIRRYADETGQLPFEDYILLLVRLLTVFDMFKSQTRLSDGRAAFEPNDEMITHMTPYSVGQLKSLMSGVTFAFGKLVVPDKERTCTCLALENKFHIYREGSSSSQCYLSEPTFSIGATHINEKHSV